ncbi:MAG: hypothetical protein J7639_18430 [Paenibacillaceae bacterium]|nr:hypothetical protein [Paenibacillaceae bacterium]
MMFEAKKQDFLSIYEESKKSRGPLPSKEDIFMEMVNLFIISRTKKDRKRYAKLILKAKASMGKHPLWEYIDEELLNDVANG